MKARPRPSPRLRGKQTRFSPILGGPPITSDVRALASRPTSLSASSAPSHEARKGHQPHLPRCICLTEKCVAASAQSRHPWRLGPPRAHTAHPPHPLHVVPISLFSLEPRPFFAPGPLKAFASQARSSRTRSSSTDMFWFCIFVSPHVDSSGQPLSLSDTTGRPSSPRDRAAPPGSQARDRRLARPRPRPQAAPGRVPGKGASRRVSGGAEGVAS